MMIKQTVFLLAASLCATLARAQEPKQNIQSTQITGQVTAQPGLSQQIMMNNFTGTAVRMGKNVNGSPYADSRWLVAHLSMSNNVLIPPLPLRYDVLNKRLVMQSSDAVSDSMQLNDNTLVEFTLDEPAANGQPARQRRFRRFTESPDPVTRQDYVEVLHQGQVTLLKHYAKKFMKAGPADGFSATMDRIDDKITYYVSRPATVPLPVKLTLKSMLLLLPDLAPALKANAAAGSARTELEWAAVLNAVDPK